MERPDRIAWFGVCSLACGLVWWLIAAGGHTWNYFLNDPGRAGAGLETVPAAYCGGLLVAVCAGFFWFVSVMYREHEARYWYSAWLGLALASSFPVHHFVFKYL